FNRLGQFFTEWKVRLTRNCVASFCRPTTKIAVYVDGTKYTGDPRAIELKDRLEIAIVIGRRPSHIPSTFPYAHAVATLETNTELGRKVVDDAKRQDLQPC